MTDPKETDPLSYQVGGSHYKKYEYQPIEFFNDVRLDFNRANAIKYIARWRQKNGVEDLKKAVQYLRFAAQEGLKVADNALRFLKQFKGPEYEIIDNILAGCVIDARKDIEDMIAREEAKAQAEEGDILEGTEWSDFSQKRLAHYIYMLQSRRATSADISAVWAYLDALRDNGLITPKGKAALLALANRVHENLLTHCEPYTKIPWPDIVATIESIAKGQIDEKEREA